MRLYAVVFDVIIATVFTDIDECSRNTDGCDHGCLNTPGSYLCTCRTGYQLQSDQHSCSGNTSHLSIRHSHARALLQYYMQYFPIKL